MLLTLTKAEVAIFGTYNNVCRFPNRVEDSTT